MSLFLVCTAAVGIQIQPEFHHSPDDSFERWVSDMSLRSSGSYLFKPCSSLLTLLPWNVHRSSLLFHRDLFSSSNLIIFSKLSTLKFATNKCNTNIIHLTEELEFNQTIYNLSDQRSYLYLASESLEKYSPAKGSRAEGKQRGISSVLGPVFGCFRAKYRDGPRQN